MDNLMHLIVKNISTGVAIRIYNSKLGRCMDGTYSRLVNVGESKILQVRDGDNYTAVNESNWSEVIGNFSCRRSSAVRLSFPEQTFTHGFTWEVYVPDLMPSSLPDDPEERKHQRIMEIENLKHKLKLKEMEAQAKLNITVEDRRDKNKKNLQKMEYEYKYKELTEKGAQDEKLARIELQGNKEKYEAEKKIANYNVVGQMVGVAMNAGATIYSATANSGIRTYNQPQSYLPPSNNYHHPALPPNFRNNNNNLQRQGQLALPAPINNNQNQVPIDQRPPPRMESPM